jgi:hypothetical protein
MIESIAKLIIAPNSRTGLLYIPSDLMVDSAFPFQAPLSVKVRIDGEKLVIEKVEEA